MNQTTTDLKREIQTSLGLIQTLRDEIRVRLHLAGMDAKEEWGKLEVEITEVERIASDFSQETCHAASEAVRRLSALRSSLN